MNARQVEALEHPCFTLDAVGRWTLRADEALPGTNWLIATTLTVDAYTAPLRWHACAALQVAPQLFVPYEELEHEQRRALCHACMRLLDGVGVLATRYAETAPYSFHLLQRLSDQEALRVAQRRQVLPDFYLPMGHIDTITREEAIDGYGWNADRNLQSER